MPRFKEECAGQPGNSGEQLQDRASKTLSLWKLVAAALRANGKGGRGGGGEGDQASFVQGHHTDDRSYVTPQMLSA